MLFLTLIGEWTLRNLLPSSEFGYRRTGEGNCLRRIIRLPHCHLANRTGTVGFEVLTPVTTKITVCWVVTSLVFELLIDVSEEPAVSSIMVDWSHLNLWLWIVTS
jgi:hypothetical protein